MQTLLAAKPEVIDREAILQLLDHDIALLREIARMFLDEAPLALGEIRAAVAQQNAGQLERAAHKLKGSTGTFAASSACAAAQRLEEMGRHGELAHAGQAVDRLAQALNAVVEALLAWLAELPA